MNHARALPPPIAEDSAERLARARQPMTESQALAYAKAWGLRAEAHASGCREAARKGDMAALIREAKALSRALYLTHPELFGRDDPTGSSQP